MLLKRKQTMTSTHGPALIFCSLLQKFRGKALNEKLLILMFSALFVLCSAGVAPAENSLQEQKNGFKVYSLGQIIVTGKRQKEKTGISTIVTSAKIKAEDSHTVAEALQYVPGLFVTTGYKSEPDVTIHGFDQSHILILIDGVPYYETKYGSLDLNQITTDNISEIIVEKGNQSVLYGANAEAGVINIITKKSSGKPFISAKIEAGEKNASRVSISHGMKYGNLNYWLNYTHKKSDAWRLSDKFTPRLGKVKIRPGATTSDYLEDGGNFRDNSDYKNNSFWAKVGVEPSPDSEYYINFHSSATEKGEVPNLDSIKVFTSRPAFSHFARIKKYDDWGIDLSGRQRLSDKFSIKAKGFYHNHVDDYVSYDDKTYNNQIADSRYKDYFAGGMMLFDFKPVDWDFLKLAVHYKGDSHKQRDDTYLPFAESFSYTGSIGLENTFLKIKNLTVIVGTSYDWFNVDRAETNITDRATGNLIQQQKLDTPGIQDEINPMISAEYAFSNSTKLFGAIAKKTRFPTLEQLYSTRSGNIDLNSEKSINYSAGVSKAFGHLLTLEFSPFYHDVSDRISRNGQHLDGRYENYAKVEMAGFEFNSELTPVDALRLHMGYTYNDAKDKSSGRVTDKVTGTPKHKVDASLRYKIFPFGTCFYFNMLYADSTYSQLPTPDNPSASVLENDSFTVFNCKISQAFLKHWEASLAVNNLFDRNYEPESGFPAPGRTIWLGISAKF